MENPEGVLNLLDEFAKLKSKEIPNDLEEYLLYVAASGDPVYQWSLIKSLYRQKLINVITEFYEMCPVIDIPRCPNVDPFNYETMKNSLLKRLDSFSSAPFTIQRISELLTTPRKQYNRVDKFMRAIEKNIWVVSTREPGPREPASTQDTSTNLVNGVSPRVCVTVKHPKRVKSIEERIKSGHPQLIDDDEDDDEDEEEEMDEYETMEEETSSEILPNTDADDTSLQCTSVKNLIEKYENGTIFSNAEEKPDFEEKPANLEEVSVECAPATASASTSAPESADSSASKSSEQEFSNPPPSEPGAESSPEEPATAAASSTVANSVQEATSSTFYAENEKEASAAPIVAADSSSDAAEQGGEVVEGSGGEAAGGVDSNSDISVDGSSQPPAESSTSKSELTVCENDAEAAMAEVPMETSTSDTCSGADEEFQAMPEPSSDSMTEAQTKEADTLNENAGSECI